MKKCRPQWLWFTLLLVVILSIGSASEIACVVAAADSVLRVATTATPPSLDPVDTAVSTREVSLNVFEPLVAFNSQFEVCPMLAEAWDVSSDGKRYTFHLRKGVPFHDGSKMTSRDVKASFDRYRSVSPRASNLEAVTDVHVVDDYTVEFNLSRPDGAFLNNLATPVGMIAIMPADMIAGVGFRKLTPAQAIGTGPYKISEWLSDQYIRLVRFEGYKPLDEAASGYAGRKEAHIEEVRLIPVPEPSARVIGLRTGQYDFADWIPATEASQLKALSDVKLVDTGPYGIEVVWINHAGILGENKKLRQAIQAALDMEEIMMVATDGSGSLSPGFHLPGQTWYSDSGKEYYNQKDLEKARSLLVESGYRGEPIRFATNTDYQDMYRAAICIQQQLQTLGVNIQLDVNDFSGMMEKATRPGGTGWDLMSMSHSMRFDPAENFDQYIRAKTSQLNYEPSEEIVLLLDRARTSGDTRERTTLYGRLQQHMYQEAELWFKLFDLSRYQGYRSYVKGYVPWATMKFYNVQIEK